MEWFFNFTDRSVLSLSYKKTADINRRQGVQFCLLRVYMKPHAGTDNGRKINSHCEAWPAGVEVSVEIGRDLSDTPEYCRDKRPDGISYGSKYSAKDPAEEVEWRADY